MKTYTVHAVDPKEGPYSKKWTAGPFFSRPAAEEAAVNFTAQGLSARIDEDEEPTA